MRCDLVVVGGGPVGCFTAAHVAKGFSITILEEHQQVGVPEQCAGLIAPRVVEMGKAQDAILNRIDGAAVHFPGGRTVRLKGEETKAFVVDRRRFDEHCLDMALANGAEYRTGMAFRDGALKEGCAILRTDKENLEARLVVGADGYKSSVGRAFGLTRPKEFVRGIQVDLDVRVGDQSDVDVWVGKDLAPGFFAWRIPCGDITRLGLCASDGLPSDHLKRLLIKTGHENAKRIRLYSGMIPLGPLASASAERVMLVGDAAAQVKPVSGGGLFPGLSAAMVAAEVASCCLRDDDCSAQRLREYDRAWKARIGKELDRGYRIRRAFVRMSDEDLDIAGRLLDTEASRRVLGQGDIDHPTEIAKDLLKAAPGLMRFAPQLLASMFAR